MLDLSPDEVGGACDELICLPPVPGERLVGSVEQLNDNRCQTRGIERTRIAAVSPVFRSLN